MLRKRLLIIVGLLWLAACGGDAMSISQSNDLRFASVYARDTFLWGIKEHYCQTSAGHIVECDLDEEDGVITTSEGTLVASLAFDAFDFPFRSYFCSTEAGTVVECDLDREGDHYVVEPTGATLVAAFGHNNLVTTGFGLYETFWCESTAGDVIECDLEWESDHYVVQPAGATLVGAYAHDDLITNIDVLHTYYCYKGQQDTLVTCSP